VCQSSAFTIANRNFKGTFYQSSPESRLQCSNLAEPSSPLNLPYILGLFSSTAQRQYASMLSNTRTSL
jgi:hypothetical protein